MGKLFFIPIVPDCDKKRRLDHMKRSSTLVHVERTGRSAGGPLPANLDVDISLIDVKKIVLRAKEGGGASARQRQGSAYP
jgi:hypothetical protein